MDATFSGVTFSSSSQRVASTYARLLAEFCPVLTSNLPAAAQQDLHSFFRAFYDALYAAPDAFGLPLSNDAYYLVDHSKEGPDKTEIKRILDRSRKLVEEGLDFLRLAGVYGQLDGSALLLDVDAAPLAFLKKKTGKAWKSGLSQAGMVVLEAGGTVTLTNTRFPGMFPAFKEMAVTCSKCDNANLGRVFFARCDLRALANDFTVDPLDLFRIFQPEDAAWAAELHRFFIGREYQAQVTFERIFQWDVKYQGKKSVKASPLFQIDYDERLLRQMKAYIKCASSGRVVPLLAVQSHALQDDFSHRVIPCGNCHWCDNKKGYFSPQEYEYQGNQRKICWYVNSDLNEFNEQSIVLVKEYALMHEGLG